MPVLKIDPTAYNRLLDIFDRASITVDEWEMQSGLTLVVESPRLDRTAADRKAEPIYSGVLKYFPLAMGAVAHLSKVGNDQHNPGQPLHWAKEKSTDHEDCIARHLVDHSRDPVDTDGELHLTKVAWRSLAALETYLEARLAVAAPTASAQPPCSGHADAGPKGSPTSG